MNDNSKRCDHCGSDLIDRCFNCGAPVCCPSCCKIDHLSSCVEALETELAGKEAVIAVLKSDLEYYRRQP